MNSLPVLDIVLHCGACGAKVTTAWSPGKPGIDCPCGTPYRFSLDEMWGGYNRAIKREAGKSRRSFRV